MVIWSDPPGKAVFHPNEGHMAGVRHILCGTYRMAHTTYLTEYGSTMMLVVHTDTPCFAHKIHLRACSVAFHCSI